MRYGWRRDSLDRRDRAFAYKLTRVELPPSVDLEPFCPAVYDQGDLGSCTGNATAAGLDICRKLQDLPFVSPSRLMLYYLGREADGTTAVDCGAQIRDVVKAAARYGACAESVWPYQIDRFTVRPSSEAFRDATNNRAISYPAIDQDIAHIRSCLADQVPIVFGFTVYDSFESNAVAQTGIMPMPLHGESPRGGHAVVAVGYDDSTRRVKVRNSWGSRWGNHGYFYMPYEYITDPDLAADFRGIRLVTEPAPSP